MAVVQSNSSTGCILAIRNTLRLHLCRSEGRNLRFGQMASAKVISPPTDGSWAYCQNVWLFHSFRRSDLKSWDHNEKPRGTPEKKSGRVDAALLGDGDALPFFCSFQKHAFHCGVLCCGDYHKNIFNRLSGCSWAVHGELFSEAISGSLLDLGNDFRE